MPPAKKKPGRPKGSKNKAVAGDTAVNYLAGIESELRALKRLLRWTLEANGYRVPPEE